MTDTGNGKKQHSISREALLKMLSGSSMTNSVAPKNAANNGNGNNEKENVPVGYQQTNKIMVQQIRQLKQELTSSKRQTEELRRENFRLTERLHAIEASTDGERVEMILNERLKVKLGQLTHISKRCIDTMEKYKAEYERVLGEIGADTLGFDEATIPKPGAPRMLLQNLMDKVEESPVKLVEPASTSTVRRASTRKRVKREPEDPDATPKAVDSNTDDELQTPRVARLPAKKKAELPSKTPRNLPGQHDELARPPETPLDFPNPFVETDTVRRRRQATLRVNTYVLPALNTKLRRPGKSDEPNPYIQPNPYIS